MISRSLKQQANVGIEIEHVFSAEIEPVRVMLLSTVCALRRRASAAPALAWL